MFVTAASLTLGDKEYKGNINVKYWNFWGCWGTVVLCGNMSASCIMKERCVGDLTLMIPVNPGISWKTAKRYTKARYARSVLRLLHLSFSWKNVKTVGKTSLTVAGIDSFKFSFRKVLITLLWKSVSYLLLGLCGTSVCSGLKLRIAHWD